MLHYPRSNKAREWMCLQLSNTSVKSSQTFLFTDIFFIKKKKNTQMKKAINKWQSLLL